MALSSSTRFGVVAGVHARRFGDEMVLLDLAGGQYYGLNEMGAAIWDWLAGGRSVAEIVRELCATYDVTYEQIEVDVCALVEELTNRGLLAPLAT